MMIINESKNHIIFYDGFCLLCSRFVQHLIKLDKSKNFKYAHISTNFSKSFLKNKIKADDIGKFIVYYSKGKFYFKSDAIIQIFLDLGGIFKVLLLLKIFPLKIRNFTYDTFSKNRYQWFGKIKECNVQYLNSKERYIND